MARGKDRPEAPAEGVTPPAACDYCGEKIPAGRGVTASGNGVTVRTCTWRGLHRRLVDIFTTGRQKEAGME
jgi:hypothetical protein